MKKTKLASSLKKFHNKYLSDCLFTLLIFAIMIIIISNPTKFTAGTISGLKLFFYSVLPGLFPFMLLTKLLTEIGFLFKITKRFDKFTHKVFGTPGVSLYAFLMSILSGYPIGAKIISDLYDKQLISENDAKKMSFFCTTSGPIFIIGAVGSGMFGSLKIGVILYFSHIVSSIILGICYNLLTKNKTSSKHEITYSSKLSKHNNIFASAVNQTINSLFIVGAYITIFYLISELLNSFNVFSIISSWIAPFASKIGINEISIKGVLYGLLEVTRGAKELSINFSSTSIALCSGILSFSGISIIMQSMTFLKTAKIKTHTFVFAKCVHSLLSVFLCLLLLIFFG